MLYTFYGDDFTGSTDVLEQLASAGVPAVLFLRPPSPEDLAQFSDVEAVGLAGDSRSQSPAWMSEHLPRIFNGLAAFGAPVLHYKTCSTFDSSPTHGSIGRAIELAIDTLHPRFVPIVVGTPHLRRYVIDANLFAAAPDGAIRRIDQHPMRNHPVTPMREPNLLAHLARQTSLHIVHRHANTFAPDAPAPPAFLASQERAHDDSRSTPQPSGIALFDTYDAATLKAAGELIWSEAQLQPVFGVGSSGLTAALVAAWRSAGRIPPQHTSGAALPARPLLVLSGSCSPVTEQQIRWALANGFDGIALDPQTFHEGSSTFDNALDKAVHSLQHGRDTVLYTALGAPDAKAVGARLGVALGRMLAAILERISITRAVLCGGDTSSHAVQQLGLTALTLAAQLQPGAPLCRAHGPALARTLELVLKGGQVGTEDFFAWVRNGAAAN